jgi:hypothetical protein
MKKGLFWDKKGFFRLKRGQNQGFAVTDSSTGIKCKLLISCKLQAMEGPKKDFHRQGGWG